MTNYEHYKEQIEKITRLGYQVAVNANNNQPYVCNKLDCNDCIVSQIDGYDCYKAISEWADEEYIEPEKQVDWSKVAVDTPILVSDDNERWYRSYFAKYDNEDHQVWTWRGGRTSWSIYYDGAYFVSDKEVWKYAKLAEVEL